MSKKSFYINLDSMLERDFNVKETLMLLSSSGSIMWSWGGHRFTNLSNKGLIFMVNGHHHKGLVLITLGWNDTYTFRLLSRQYNEVYKETDVYFDELATRIDEKIEKIPEYEF